MQPRYSPTNQALHWATAALVFAILPLAWVMTNTKANTPVHDALYNWHKTLGLAVLAITLFRIVWRLVDRPPPYPSAVAAWDKRLAQVAYGLFFLVLLGMPITGYLTSGYGGHPPVLFNLVPTPSVLPGDRHLAQVFGSLHAIGQWLVYALIGLHLSAVAFHLIYRQDGVLGRMLPAHATEPAPFAGATSKLGGAEGVAVPQRRSAAPAADYARMREPTRRPSN